jgi:hypothetical protein
VFASWLLLALTGGAAAQGFVPRDRPEDEEEADETQYAGRITSTTFGFRETGEVGEPLAVGAAPPDNASPVRRYFTDIRAVLQATHLRGSKWDARFDGRARGNGNGPPTSRAQDDPGENLPTQSGTFGGSELDLRELYLQRRGERNDLIFGRQIVLEIAATKVDGVRLVRRSSPRIEYIGFGGFYPTRGSRSILDDYPRAPVAPGEPASDSKRVTPVALGGGMAYRYPRIYGAVGAGVILPLARERPEVAGTEGPLEQNRAFASSNGYWRKSPTLDLYHFVVGEARGNQLAFNNLTAGLNWHPTSDFRVTASGSHIDTETLNVTAQTRLEDPDPLAPPLIQNNVEVLRIASQQVRLGVSSAFREQRFELSVDTQIRRRPEFTVTRGDGTEFTFTESQAADITFSAVDRRSLLDIRLFGAVTSIFGIGDRNLNNTEAKIIRVGGRKPLNEARTEIEVDVSYLTSDDDGQGSMATCGVGMAGNPFDCYGTASVQTLQLGGVVFHQLNPRWFVVGSARLGVTNMTTGDLTNTMLQAQPPVLSTIGFFRVDYRFR